MLGEQTGPFVKDRWCSPEWCAPSQGQNIRNSRLYSESSRNPCEDEQCSAVRPISGRAAVVPCQLRRKGWTGMLNPEPRVKLPRCLINPDLHSLICVRKGPVFHAATPLSGNQQSTQKQEFRVVCVAPHWCEEPGAKSSSKSLRMGWDPSKTYRSWLHRKWRHGGKKSYL